MKKKIENSTVKKILEEAERAARHTTDLVEANELEPYMNGVDINGNMVEESEDITPEQVAILGAHTMAIQLRDNLKRITEGKEPKVKSTNIEVHAIEIKGSKAKKVDLKDIPPEVRDALRKLINGEDEDE